MEEKIYKSCIPTFCNSFNFNRKKILLALCLGFTLTTYTYGQNRTSYAQINIVKTQEEFRLSGTILDNQSAPVANVTIRVEGRDNSITKSDDEGNFTINVEMNSTLVFSAVGFETQKIKIDSKKKLTVILLADQNTIEETVVTGIGRKTKESFTGAAVVITRKEIERFNNNNIFSILAALDPALNIDNNNITNGSNPNVVPEISIRGASSLGEYSVNAPLVVIDGLESNLTALYNMDITRIESISILKDASSAILYGSRGANGVIVIETRMPKAGALTITYELRPSVTLVDLTDYTLMDAGQKLNFEKITGIYNTKISNATTVMRSEFLTNLYNKRLNDVQRGVNTYWLYQPIQSSTSFNHNLRIEGGNDVRYALYGSYLDRIGAMKGSGNKNINAGFDISYRIIDKITFTNKFTYEQNNSKNSPYGSYTQYSRLNPYESIYDENGELIKFYNDFTNDLVGTGITNSDLNFPLIINPLYNATLPSLDQSETSTIRNQLFLDYFAAKSLRLSFNGAITRSFIANDKYTSPFNTIYDNEPDPTLRGQYIVGNGNETNFEGRITGTYSKNIHKHALNLSASADINASLGESTSYTLRGFADDRYIAQNLAFQFSPNTLPTFSSNPYRRVGALINANYIYDKKYVAELGYRIDGSSNFSKAKRFVEFWTAGLAYNLHQEEFFHNDFINVLRIRANAGISGADQFSPGMMYNSYKYGAEGRYYDHYAAIYAGQGNDNLKWPETFQYSFGIDATFWNNRANIYANYYNKKTSDMVVNIPVAPSQGFGGNAFFMNIGDLENKGFEFNSSLTVMQAPIKNFYWILTAGGRVNRNKLWNITDQLKALNDRNMVTETDINDRVIVTKPPTKYEEGKSTSRIIGVPSLGINPSNGQEVFLDRFGNPTQIWNVLDMVEIGETTPDFAGTFGTSIQYEGFSLSAYFQYSVGGDIYNQTLLEKIENASRYYNADVRVLESRWQNPGDITKFKSIYTVNTQSTQVTSRFVQKESYVTFNSLNLNYEFKKELIKKWKLQRARLNFSMNDGFRVSTVRMERGLSYPFARTYNFGILAQF